LAAALPLVAHLGLLFTFDLASHLGATLGLTTLGFYGVVRATTLLSGMSRGKSFVILLVAVILRCALLPLPPSLSDDIYRYVWDGRVLNAGHNPYALEPDSPELSGLRDSLWEQLPHREVATVYPPLAVGAFSIAARLPEPVAAIKALLVLADLLTCGLLLVCCRRLGLPAERAVWYAWNPLVILEVAGMGHVDALGVLATVLVVLFLLHARRPVLASVSAAAAVLAKLIPAVALPVWANQSGRPWRFILLAGGLIAAGLTPVVVASGGLPPGLVTFGVTWEFNGPLYEPLWRLLQALNVPQAVHAGLDQLKLLTGQHDFWNLFYPFNYPQFEAKILLAVLFVAALWRIWPDPDPVRGTGRIFGALVLFSSTVYPGYLLWILPWASLARHRAWLALSWLILLSYVPQISQPVELFPWVYLTMWGPFMLLLWRSKWSID